MEPMLSDERESCVILQHVWHLVYHVSFAKTVLAVQFISLRVSPFFGIDLFMIVLSHYSKSI